MALQLLEVEAWVSRRLFEREITAPASPVMARGDGGAPGASVPWRLLSSAVYHFFPCHTLPPASIGVGYTEVLRLLAASLAKLESAGDQESELSRRMSLL